MTRHLRQQRTGSTAALMLAVCGGLWAARVLASMTPSQDARPVMTVGTARADRGHAAIGHLNVEAGADAATTIDVAVIHGAKPGKVVAFVAGSHGTEYASIVALTRLVSKIDPQALTGTLVILPLLN